MKIKILGSGTADGYPRITNNYCNNIDNSNKKNIRLRCSFYLQDNNDNLLVECGPDIRQQTIEYNRNKPNDKNIIIIQSWNEWGEGNHLEPDLKYGLGYLEAIKNAREKYNV